MPRIDPLSLLKCLSVLLGSTGGIKSKEEVQRLSTLMTKFSKKLVSKCIYIQILKTTDSDLLNQFMGVGGWHLVYAWLTDGIVAKNWALIQELLELLLLCPVNVERLKSNNCPKMIKGLSKEGSHQGVRVLASRVVEQWLKIVKAETANNSVPAQIITLPGSSKPIAIVHARPASVISTTQISFNEKNETDKNVQLAQSNSLIIAEAQEIQHIDQQQQQHDLNESHYQQITEKAVSVEPLQLPIATNNKPSAQALCQLQKKQSYVIPSVQTSAAGGGAGPVYKITIRDGNRLLTKLETDAAHINNAIDLPNTEINGEPANESLESKDFREIAEDSSVGIGFDVGGSSSSTQKVEDLLLNKSSAKVAEGTAIESTDLDHSEIIHVVNSKDNCEADNINIKDNKDVKPVIVSDSSSKSISDKENRNSTKKESDKKSSNTSNSSSSSSSSGSSTDKKSSHHSSSSSSSCSKSSSKHSSKESSSSHRSGSNSHRSSVHRSSSSKSATSKDKAKEKDKDSKDKHHSSSSNSKHSSSNKNRSDRDKEREKEKEKLKKDQAEKDKATLEKVQGPALSLKLGKIPKKKTDDERSSDVLMKKSSVESKEGKDKDKIDAKKAATVSAISEKKNISISIENRKTCLDSTTRPKTVKTFNSKFRSTGLEEEAKPPPPRSIKRLNQMVDKKIIPSKLSSLKSSSPLRETSSSADKRPRLSLDSPVTPPADEKKGGIKLIPPKPKPMVLQESDMFMDALTASTKNKEPRKRKRRTSLSKDNPSEVKKLDSSNNENNRDDFNSSLASPNNAATSQKSEDKTLLKPTFKFYQDTLETEEDKEQKGKVKIEGVNAKMKDDNGEGEAEEDRDDDDDEDDEDEEEEEEPKNKIMKESNENDERSRTPTPEDTFGEKAVDSNQGPDSLNKEVRYVDGLRSVLLLQKRKGPKKTLKWKVDLESIRYFELDETERVNVTKTFTDMKQIEKQNEREAFQMARKLSTEDLMEEKTRWRSLIPIDTPPALVEPGKDSREKDIQYAREKGILQALYFHRNMIPDTPAEPEEERLLTVIDAKIIPLEDLTGTKASEKDYTTIPWPEPKPQLPSVQPVTMTNFHYQAFPHNQHPMLPSMGPSQQASMGPVPPMPQPIMNAMNQMGAEMVGGPLPPVGGGSGGGGWRTGDGKVVVPDINTGINAMPNIPGGGYPPQGMDGQMVPPPGMMGPPMYNQPDGFMMGPDDMSYNNVPNNFQGPPGPVMFGPGPNFQGGPRGGGPMHVNRGRGAPPGAGWFRGGPPVRGVGWRGGWRGNAKQPPVCRQFSKSGYCRAENKCQFLHPGVNCPPF